MGRKPNNFNSFLTFRYTRSVWETLAHQLKIFPGEILRAHSSIGICWQEPEPHWFCRGGLTVCKLFSIYFYPQANFSLRIVSIHLSILLDGYLFCVTSKLVIFEWLKGIYKWPGILRFLNETKKLISIEQKKRFLIFLKYICGKMEILKFTYSKIAYQLFCKISLRDVYPLCNLNNCEKSEWSCA